MLPFFQNLEKLIGNDRAETLRASGVIKQVPLTFFRGLTWDNAVIVYDEAQNSSQSSMKAFLTRIGQDSKMIVAGDIRQSDIGYDNGLRNAIERLSALNEIGTLEFTREDIVRHGLIAKILKAYEG